MTEANWLSSNTATELIEYVADQASERKLRLFACAGCRRILHVMQHEESRQAVEISERFADGQASPQELRSVEVSAQSWADTTERLQTLGWNAARTAALAANEQALRAAQRAAHRAGDGDLVREHFGNPFLPFSIPADILSWQDKTVVRLAQGAYDERLLPSGLLDRMRLLILADALEEAGCTDEQILTHLRSDGAHYRGCFVIDALLGKG